MVYNDEARKVAIKAIGTVESNLRYDAINYNDPITVGVAQWFGTRAADILETMRVENPSAWVGVAPSLTQALDDHDTNSRWWNSRYLTRAEGESLRPVLIANQAVQNTQFATDIDAYVDVAERNGMDKDENTAAVLFFASMYHQSPVRALAVLRAIGANSSLDRFHQAALNEPILGQYRSRQNTVHQIISEWDFSGVEDPATPSPPPEEGGDGGSDDTGTGGNDPTTRLAGDIRYIQAWGDNLYIQLKDGNKLTCYPNGSGIWVATLDKDVGSDVEPPPVNPDPIEPPSSDAQAKRVAITTWLADRMHAYRYSQGAGRMSPDVSGYTDCSALMNYAFKQVLNINIGTYTGAQYTQGRRIQSGSGNIDLNNIELGDLIFFNWVGGRNTVDHVEMYYGNGNNIGHGGPGTGPHVKPAQPQANRAINWYVQRFIE